MRFTEKLKITLKKAYEQYAVNESRQYCDLKELMNAADIITDHEEVVNLGKRLEGDGLVIFHLKYGKNGTPHIYLTSDGIDLCESGTLFDIVIPLKKENTNLIDTPEVTENTDIDVANNENIVVTNIDEVVNSQEQEAEIAEPVKKVHSLLQLLQEIKIAATLSEDLRVREIKELVERIEELTVFINAEQRIPKFGFNDFLLAINEMESMDSYLPDLDKYLS